MLKLYTRIPSSKAMQYVAIIATIKQVHFISAFFGKDFLKLSAILKSKFRQTINNYGVFKININSSVASWRGIKKVEDEKLSSTFGSSCKTCAGIPLLSRPE